MMNDAENMGDRMLGQQEDFDMGSRMAQIFSGCMFAALAVYLIFSNSTRLTVIQKQSFAKRLHVCCQINTIVAAISAFLNFFQLTEVDNFLLPGQRGAEGFTVDVARPLEWILTCPMMQLCLVIMGGPKIPEYRRAMMPGLAAVVLLFGASTLFVPEKGLVLPLFAMGAMTHCVAMFFNRQQILEHSDGAEGLLNGDSEYRKVTLVLMLTWFPFPIWFMLTPEGLGLIEDVVVIQMGWACLNIVSKFTLIFFIQRVKDTYWARIKLMREFNVKAALPGIGGGQFTDADMYDIEDDLDLAPAPTVVPMPGVVPTTPHQQPTAQPLNQQVYDFRKPSISDEKSTADGSSVDLEPLEKKMEQMEQQNQQMESRLLEKFDIVIQSMAQNKGVASVQQSESPLDQQELGKKIDKSTEYIREKLGCAMGDLGKAMEKSQSMFEVKMEMALAAQNTERQSVQAVICSQLQEWPEKFFERMAESCDTNRASIEAMQTYLDNATQKLQALQDSQDSVMATLGGSLTQMTDGWAQQIIQENKATAFTLQTKIGVLEEMQSRKQGELEERMAKKLQQSVNEGMEKMQAVVVQQTTASTEKLHASIEASKSVNLGGNGQLEQNLAQQIKDMNQDVAKHVEAGIGVFGNSLRAQLDGLQSQQLAQRMESESNLGSKWDGLMARMQQQSNKQVEQMNQYMEAMVKENMEKASKDQTSGLKQLERYMEDIARAQQDRHGDMYSMITSVLEQSCGAKSRAEDVAAMLSERQGGQFSTNDSGSWPIENRHTIGSSIPPLSPRPNTAGVSRLLTRRRSGSGSNHDDSASSPSYRPTKGSNSGDPQTPSSSHGKASRHGPQWGMNS